MTIADVNMIAAAAELCGSRFSQQQTGAFILATEASANGQPTVADGQLTVADGQLTVADGQLTDTDGQPTVPMANRPYRWPTDRCRWQPTVGRWR